MARKPNAPFLDAGDRFPPLELTLIDGRRLTLPEDLSRPYNVVLINRGAWCPYARHTPLWRRRRADVTAEAVHRLDQVLRRVR